MGVAATSLERKEAHKFKVAIKEINIVRII
jgi:hypothetical protein